MASAPSTSRFPGLGASSVLACLAGLTGLMACSESFDDPGPDARNRPRTSASAERLTGEGGLREDIDAVWPVSGRRHVLVRLARIPLRHDRSRLARAGVAILQRSGQNTYYATLGRQGAPRPRVDQLAGTIGVRRLRMDEKLHPSLLRDALPAWMQDPTAEEPRTVGTFYVQLFPDEAHCVEDPRSLGLSSAEVRGRTASVPVLVVRAPWPRVRRLASDDRVQWIEPALPPLASLSLVGARPDAQARRSTQADQLHGPPYDLDGSGVRVLLFDGGVPRTSHVDLSGRVRARESLAVGEHATHVAGIIGGSGAASGGAHAGHAPGVRIDAYGLEFPDPRGPAFYFDPGDLEADYRRAMNRQGVVLANNSIGINVDINGLPCNLFGDYGVTSALIDGIVRGALGRPLRVVWAAGNERTRTFFDGNGQVIFAPPECLNSKQGYATISPPAAAKNPLCVGAIHSSDDSMTVFSSWGPCDDGRVKPDLVAPGCDSGGGGIVSTFSRHDADYAALCGTSMSAPAATGCAALLIQALRREFGEPLPLNSTIKALLIQSAKDLHTPGPDYRTGYGAIQIRDTVDSLEVGRFLEDRLEAPLQRKSFAIEIGPLTEELKVTLAWDDPPQVPGVFGALVNDLGLEVRDPAGRRHHPWVLDPLHPEVGAVRTRADHLNNVEQVQVADPMPGTWTVEVHASDTPALPQVFSMASSHALMAGRGVELRLLGDLPAVVPSATSLPLRVLARGTGGEILAGPVVVRYRVGPGRDMRRRVLRADSGHGFVTELPGPLCDAPLEFYLEARGAHSGIHTLPPGAPEHRFIVAATELEELFSDDFEQDLGWTVTSGSRLRSGHWERAVPGVGGPNAPTRDQDGSGRCFVTDNVPFQDVDGAHTRLQSPSIETPGEHIEVSFAVWCANDNQDEDELGLSATTDDGASWTRLASFQNTGGWRVHRLILDDFVEIGPRASFRFTIADRPDDSVTEAAIDRFQVESRICRCSVHESG